MAIPLWSYVGSIASNSSIGITIYFALSSHIDTDYNKLNSNYLHMVGMLLLLDTLSYSSAYHRGIEREIPNRER